MTVDAVEADVQPPAQIPLRIRQLPLIQPRERLEPRHPLTTLALPELLEAQVVDLRLRIRPRRKLGRRRIAPLLGQHRLDRLSARVRHLSSSSSGRKMKEHGGATRQLSSTEATSRQRS